MTYPIVRILLYLVCFCVSFYALTSLDLNRFFRQGRVLPAQILLIILAMSLGYLMAQFLLGLSIRSL